METMTPVTATPQSKPVVRMDMRTPWGKADSARIYADGIGSVGTPGHGGFKLSAARNKLVNAEWRKPGGWYEEDCEWSIVVLTFPECFEEKMRTDAKYTAKSWFPDEYEKVTGEKVMVEESSVLRERAFRAENANKWVTTSAWGDGEEDVPKGMVKVVATIGGVRTMGAETKFFLVPVAEYDTRSWCFGFVVDPSRHTEVEE